MRQVVGEFCVRARQAGQQPFRILGIPQRQACQLQAGDPAFGAAFEQLDGGLAEGRPQRLLQIRGSFVRV